MNVQSPIPDLDDRTKRKNHGCIQDKKQWQPLNYIIVRQHDVSDVRITTVMRGADCWMDHRMICSKLLPELQSRHRKSAAKPMKRLNVKLLRDGTTQAQLKLVCHQKMRHTTQWKKNGQLFGMRCIKHHWRHLERQNGPTRTDLMKMM